MSLDPTLQQLAVVEQAVPALADSTEGQAAGLVVTLEPRHYHPVEESLAAARPWLLQAEN